MTRRHSKDDALDRIEYLDLYLAALQVEDEYRRRAAILIVLCAGRLKMRIGEILHLHEGWIDWHRGVIKIPAFEPCGCGYCWERSSRNFRPDESEEGDDDEDEFESIEEYHYHNRFSPKTENGARVVPFNWSARVTAALEDFFEHHGVIDENYKWAERLLKNDVLPNARFLYEGSVMFNGLRATGLTFWADANLDSKAQRDSGGWGRESDTTPYRAQSPTALSNKMRRTVGKDPLVIETADFVTLDPRPFTGELFDPREIDPHSRVNPYDLGPVRNPRTANPPDDVEYDPTRFASLAAERDLPTPSERKAFIRRAEGRRQGDEQEIIDPYREALEEDDGDPAPGQSRFSEFSNSDESASADPMFVMKTVYMTALVAVSWIISFGPIA